MTETIRSGAALEDEPEPERRGRPAKKGPARSGPVQARYLPNYQFHGCLGRTPFSETWDARTPDGQRRLVKVLFGVTWPEAAREQEAIAALQSLRHPILPPMRVFRADRVA